MVTGVIKNKIDKIWNDFASGGITNPITVVEQLTYLMFIRSLDEKELEIANRKDGIFSNTELGQSMRWSKLKDKDPREIFDIISQRIFPAMKQMKHGKLPDVNEKDELVEIQVNTAFSRYMEDAMFLIPSPQVLQKII